VSKHTTCGDVDEDGVKRLVGVPVRRCRRRNVDVGAVLHGTNKARKTKTRTHTLIPKKLKQKGLTKVVKVCVEITLDFMSKGSNGCQSGYVGCIPALAELGPALAGLCK
jgi:hypothetical protein